MWQCTLSPESIERSWQSLEEIYGRESVSQARKLAGMIDEENNRSNPARNVYYTEGILKRWLEQGYRD